MIQRIQTVYILIGFLLVLGVVYFIPHDICSVPEDNMYIYSSYAGIIWIIIFSINALISILQFSNRKKQLIYISSNLIAMFGLVLTIYVFDAFFISHSDVISQNLYSHNWIFDFGFLIACVCFLLARKSIKKDEELVNSINRLR